MGNPHRWRKQPNRSHRTCYIALHKETHEMFGGKAAGTHIGYPEPRHIKTAMRNADINPEDYYFVCLEFDEKGGFRLDMNHTEGSQFVTILNMQEEN
jgi:hypothetical protein